ncbi:MAG TPA: host-nuclease inhibitor Gam family protein [Lacunisphaera sp.]|nr:host-nuclease inhibitor Gam family protein [Lacunisphaera sp.]
MKKNTRIKSTGLTNRLDFETTVDRIAYAQTELRQLEAERDAAVLVAQATHVLEIEELISEIKAKAALCEKFADEHRAELLPEKAKSTETPLSRYGFRTGMPQLKLLAKWTWEKVVEAIDRRGLDDEYIRVKREPAKDLMIADLTAKGILGEDTQPSQVGVRFFQTETFFIEPKVDGSEQVRAAS